MDVRSVVITVTATTIGVVLVGELLIPVAADEIELLTDAGQTSWASLIGVVVTISIISLVLISINGFLSGRSGRD